MVRILAAKRITKALKAAAGDANSSSNELPLDPGCMRLYSWYKPALLAHMYGITAKQTINGFYRIGDTPLEVAQQLTIYNTNNATPTTNGDSQGDIVKQEFNVVAAQFNLDPKLINTFYPPSGHQDEGRILPHIVFNDPHVPWLRQAGNSNWMTNAIDTDATGTSIVPTDDGRNRMPWMGVLVFRPEELLVGPQDAIDLGLNGMSSYNATKLPGDGVFSMTVGQYLNKITSRVYYEAGSDYSSIQTSTDSTNIIFPTKAQVSAIFGTKDDSTPLQAQKYLSHVRQINTVGFPDAGVEEEGFFSVVVSGMTGDMLEIAPSTHLVHLVSLEHIDSTLSDTADSSFYKTNNSGRIGLVSLYSWTYTCIPEAVSFVETMSALADAAQPLRPPKETLLAMVPTDGLNSIQDQASQALHDRLNAGYTIARWRAPTGEEAVAFNRGPLTPVLPEEVPGMTTTPHPTRPWPALSMTGKDYAIFDTSTGVMDNTYSSAWSLGKLMAISDSVFNAALMRFRSAIWKTASSAARLAHTNVPSRAAVLKSTGGAIKGTGSITNGNFTGPVSRINVPAVQTPPPAVTDPEIEDVFQQAIDYAVAHAATSSTSTGLFNGFDGAAANNSDWEIILNWLHDVMYLDHMPAHVMFPEPSHLHNFIQGNSQPGQTNLCPEALRFFYIDHAWIDCFLDGALSIANHLEPKYDYTRLRIKAAFNEFLAANIGSTTVKPPVPRYGFILRSSAVKSTPDLRLTVQCFRLQTGADGKTKVWTDDPNRDPLVRHTKLDEFTIFALVDCSPEEISNITFAQPPHQQRFAFDVNITATDSNGIATAVAPDITVKKLYTDPNQAPKIDPNNPPEHPDEALEWPDFDKDDQLTPTQQADFYTTSSRCISPMKITPAISALLIQKEGGTSTNPGPYTDIVPNSVVFGLEMNDPSYQLKIDGTAPLDTTGAWSYPTWQRVIWTGTTSLTAVKPQLRALKASALKASPRPSQPIFRPITIARPNPASHSLTSPAQTFLNTTRAARLANPVKATSAANPFANSPDAMFELLVHPDYRPPPPRPNVASTGIQNNIFSPLDYLSTGTISLYDVIFAIRRRGTTDTKLQLQSITIEIPVSDHGDKPDRHGNIREPLLPSADYSGAGIQMCQNVRFVPTVFSGQASTIGSDQWDGKAILGITLVPRSGLPTGTLPLVSDTRAAEASVRLASAPVMGIVDTSAQALIAQGVDPKTGHPVNKAMPRGKCLIKMTEHYANVNDKWSWCMALKKEGGDTDPWGNQM